MKPENDLKGHHIQSYLLRRKPLIALLLWCVMFNIRFSINRYAQSFLLRRKLIIMFLLWFVMFNVCLYLEMAGGSKSTLLFGNFFSPVSSLSGISQRFFFYFYWIGSALFLVTLPKRLISTSGEIKTVETETSDEPTQQDNRAARIFFVSVITLGFINVVALALIVFVLPSDKSVWQLFTGVLGVFIN